jgi:hypothetical protein
MDKISKFIIELMDSCEEVSCTDGTLYSKGDDWYFFKDHVVKLFLVDSDNVNRLLRTKFNIVDSLQTELINDILIKHYKFKGYRISNQYWSTDMDWKDIVKRYNKNKNKIV